ncbi:unnamed protein product, partial [marine sediment metagenome]
DHLLFPILDLEFEIFDLPNTKPKIKIKKTKIIFCIANLIRLLLGKDTKSIVETVDIVE